MWCLCLRNDDDDDGDDEEEEEEEEEERKKGEISKSKWSADDHNLRDRK
jgi:hypothetical protein